ncbi:histidine kinase [Roseobacter sp. YSTF-M11]|uniref:Histidine kinase n=1 Tax=Roseobacter insulae TaxID=2859783 RepID=A0A9X1K4D9_9RHOB|nr:DUF6446 family protein [Roseobacter insulae]MBW4710518.1 histidine kinase [Roseobacter insulae]
MNGKFVGIAIMLSALLAGGSLYYLQVYGFYEEVSAEVEEVRLMSFTSDAPVPILADNIRAIDAESSPIRFRACFTTPSSLAMLTETYVGLDNVVPRNAPEWFDCFDAAAIAAELDAGTALAFIGEKNVAFGVDRIVVITEDGRGYIWHELNDCGEKAYDGTIVGEECPKRDVN